MNIIHFNDLWAAARRLCRRLEGRPENWLPDLVCVAAQFADCPRSTIYIGEMQEPGAKPDSTLSAETQSLLARLSAFCFPAGESEARRVRAVRTTQQGEMRMTPQGRWIPFTAEEFTDSTRSSFRWDAHLKTGKIISPTITDAYEDGHGRLTVKVAGVIPVQRSSGADLDKGELQRYLSSIAFCPSMLLNHGSLEVSAVGPLTLRLRDREDRAGSSVDLGISEAGEPLTFNADRPRIVGKQTFITQWTASCAEFQIWEGLRVATHVEVCWHLPEGPFNWYRCEIKSFIATR